MITNNLKTKQLMVSVSEGDFFFTGSAAIVLPGITLGLNCIVGAGAVVTNILEDDQKGTGVPAHRLKYNGSK
jgi:acetyltransferase-like isoleucine patch superfamily enzyme